MQLSLFDAPRRQPVKVGDRYELRSHGMWAVHRLDGFGDVVLRGENDAGEYALAKVASLRAEPWRRWRHV